MRPAKLCIKNPISSGHTAVRPVIGNERIGNAAERDAPCLLGCDRITRYSQNLAIQSLELGKNCLKRGNLAVSGRGKRKRVKHQDHVLLAAPVAQLYLERDEARDQRGHRCEPKERATSACLGEAIVHQCAEDAPRSVTVSACVTVPVWRFVVAPWL